MGAQMRRNLTVQLDEKTIRKAKVLAAKRGSSVSKLVCEVVARLVEDADAYEVAERRALERMEKGFHLGGRPLRREEIYDR